MPPLLATLLGIALGTFVSEDLTLLGTGVLVREGRVPASLALAACAGGIFIGDVGLWFVGRLGGPALGRIRDARLVATLVQWLDASPGLAIVGSRFLPGARLPMYVAAGAWGRRPRAVLAWMAVAAIVWTPLVVLGVAAIGRATAAALTSSPHAVALTRLAIGGVAGALLLASRRTSRLDVAAVDRWIGRLRRWEFWPAWLLNAPIVCWVLVLAIRHRSLTLFTAANPGMADGGFVGESKAEILSLLPIAWTLPWLVVEPGPVAARLEAMRTGLADRGLRWPLVAKPDVSQRGIAVRWLSSETDAAAYLTAVPQRLLLQVPHDGPFEAGLYYERAPGCTRGVITSITDKRFPTVTGDGTSSIDTLIHMHPRLRLQAPLFVRRHAASMGRVPAAGEVIPLGRVGNHAQGTEFVDGRSLWSAALEQRIDAIARQVPGFHLGRFDVRYANRQAFKAGDDLAIVELNGVTAEPTHIYDPEASLADAWRSLARHWATAYRFGALNRARGHRPSSALRLMVLILQHLRTPPTTIVSD
jgi:membrane protein DedA with SNARE-associated domain